MSHMPRTRVVLVIFVVLVSSLLFTALVSAAPAVNESSDTLTSIIVSDSDDTSSLIQEDAGMYDPARIMGYNGTCSGSH